MQPSGNYYTRQKYLRQTLICIYGRMGILHHRLGDMGGKHHNGTCVAEKQRIGKTAKSIF